MANQPKPRSALTDVEITKILTFHRDGHSERDIAAIIHRSRWAIEQTIVTYDLDTFVRRNPRPLQPRKATEREDRYLLCAAKQFNDVPLRDISKIVNVPVLKSTMSRWLHDVGYGRYVACKKPQLSPKNIEERLEWAQEHKDWTPEQWKKVI